MLDRLKNILLELGSGFSFVGNQYKITIDDQDFYIRGIKGYQINNEKSYLISTSLNSQDNYGKVVNYFLEDNE